ncbi:CaiB/BaiF CoA-transferase family protein [Rhodococcus artemisiae]|uniref:CoA transferase n=1 Tax=Rhodococcus artemisiae TaxID=714159 RepID=A0ABU7L6Z2_9NOCA|nr:CoA transferase [Rhodococcus artemisiae]MEE2057309.1 CoA transferase [Rhodococcus artemisiae]
MYKGQDSRIEELPLEGFVVVDLSVGVAGGYGTRLLADGGATVLKVEATEGDPLRRWSGSGAEIGDEESGPFFQFLAGGKESLVLDPGSADVAMQVGRLLASADALIWSADSPFANIAELHPKRLEADHPHLVIVAISPFGLEGPWSGRAATEFTLQAWSGAIVGLGRGAPDRAPVQVGGRVGQFVTGTYTAIAALTGRVNSRLTGRGCLIDLSMLESIVLSLTYYPVTYHDVMERPWRTERALVLPGVQQAADGLVGMACGTLQQRQDLYVMMDHAEWIEDDAIMSRPAEVAPLIAEWVAERTVDEIRELGIAFRIPHAPVADPSNVATLDHFEARNVFVENPYGKFLQPRRPFQVSSFTWAAPQPSPALGAHHDPFGPVRTHNDGGSGTLPFAGLRVLDMTAFWAGPTATHLLALLGADVIHLESVVRPDGGRLVGGVSGDVDMWWERSPIHLGGNANKKSVTLDFTTDEGRVLLERLIETCDVLVENFTPRVLDQAGLDYERVKEIRPDIVMVRMPGFGLDGPWRDIAAFAYAIEDAAGLTWMTGYPDRNPLEPSCIGDPNAGMHAVYGLLLALEHRAATGEGALVEASMIDAALSITAEQIIEYTATGSILTRQGNRGPDAAPQGLYRTKDVDEFGRLDSWVALAVENDAQWCSLVDALSEVPEFRDSRFASAAGRLEYHDEIDKLMQAWCEGRESERIVDLLWSAGVPVAKMMQPHRQTEIEQLNARKFFEDMEHPVAGRYRQSTLPFTMTGLPERLTQHPAPLLGQHNEDELKALGVTDDDLRVLEENGVIGRAPAR